MRNWFLSWLITGSLGMKIWLIRHAKPLVEKGLCYGRLDVRADQSLTELASDNLMNALSESSGVKVLFTSPRQRTCLLYTSPSPRDLSTSRMPSSA